MTSKLNALRHGLSSKTAWQSLDAEISDLANLLGEGLPKTLGIEDACLALAEATLQLSRISAVRRQLFDMAGQGKMGPQEETFSELKRQFSGGADAIAAHQQKKMQQRDAFFAREPSERIASIMPDTCDELSRLADYERKARSRRDRALRRLDYLTTEARRV